MARHLRTPLSMLAIAALAAGCQADPAANNGQDDYLGTGARLSLDYFADTDVVGFHAVVERVACDASDSFEPFTLEANVDLVDGIFPAMIEMVEQTLDPDSRHLGADLFVNLDPGCYDVTMIPASDIDGETWLPSEDCSVASAEDLEVVGGETTEAMMISQCVGDENGALDTLVVLNHPPVLAVDIDEKFNYECEPVEICATAYDPDDDPLEFDLFPLGEFEPFSVELGDQEVIGFEDGHRIWRQCATVVTDIVDTHEFLVEVRDLGWQDGEMVPMEDLVAPEESSASMVVPVHTNWIEEPLCFDDGELVPVPGSEIERAPGCEYIDAEEYYCNAENTYGVDADVRQFLCDGTDLIEEALYPECDGETGGQDGGADEICDGLDNDGDGLVDEGFGVTGPIWSWTHLGSGGIGAGKVLETVASYDTDSGQLHFQSAIEAFDGVLPDFFSLVINDGPHPNEPGEYATIYVDLTGDDPVVTVYGYNATGDIDLSSYRDGSDAPGVQPPDLIASSLQDDDFLLGLKSAVIGDVLNVSLTIDTDELNDHASPYGDFQGIRFDDQIGVWYIPTAGTRTQYGNGRLVHLAFDSYSWVDVLFDETFMTDTCLAGVPVDSPF